jgi:hypothetical protein
VRSPLVLDTTYTHRVDVERAAHGVPKLHCVPAPHRKHRWCSVQSGRRFTNFTVTSTKKVRQIDFGYKGD